MSMMRLVHENRVPYGGRYVLDRPDIGMVGIGTTFDMLEKQVLKYRHANGIPVGLGFRAELEKAVCEAYPNECVETDPTYPPPARRHSLNEILLGIRVLGAFVTEAVKNGARPVVSPEEARRRADVCVKCKQNVQFSKPCGSGCGELREFIKFLVGNQPTPHASDLHACNICGCYLESAVWMDLDIQTKPLTPNQKLQFQKVPNCWKKTPTT